MSNKKRFFLEKLNENIITLFKTSVKISFNQPGYILFMIKTFLRQKKAIRKRKQWEETGLHVPPFMILSITDKCNLKCQGCYASLHSNKNADEISEKTLRRILSEARELGISIILIAGGEPFSRKEVIDILQDFPGIIFPVFTNGLLLNQGFINKLKRAKNIFPIISLEGKEDETDIRRGKGVYSQLKNTLLNLKKRKIINGISFTLTRDNFSVVTDRDFIEKLIQNGSQVFFFIEYVPVAEGTESLIITKEQRMELKEIVEKMRSELAGIFISFPGDEEELGGCLAAGRGFIHVNAHGNIEPCPFAPYSDLNLSDISLKEGLQSKLLSKIRSNGDILEEAEGQGGCTLWAKQEVVRSLLEETKKAVSKDR
ncbi:MAG: radical SAM/SPASM domain-containing protein [bacterium]